MKRLNLLNALVSAFVLLVLAAFIMGLQLSLDGTKLVVNGAGEVRWTWIAIGCAIVFVFQLFRPMVSSGLKKSQVRAGFCPALMARRRNKNCWRWC